MTTENRTTPEEDALQALYEQEDLCAATRTIAAEAHLLSYKWNMAKNYCCQIEETDDAIEKMRLLASGLPERGLAQLADIARAALSAGASIDPFDKDTLVGYRVCPADLYEFYDTIFGLIANTYRNETHSRRDRQEPPKDSSDVPF